MNTPAVVMNMYYTGLGIARSLGERGVRVVGLSSERSVYGNSTRYAEIRVSPNSRSEPQECFEFLMKLGREIGPGAILFPTRDDDVALIDEHRDELGRYFVAVIPSRAVVNACLDKWGTYLWAREAGIGVPRTWMVTEPRDVEQVAAEASYPCVVKPVCSRDWHRQGNWNIVGARKAVGISSREELLREYAVICSAEPTMIVQEQIPGSDDQLFVAACYFDRASRMVAGFTARKLVQSPEQFGTGCIVQAVDRPELLELAERLLKARQFVGIAEVEFKKDLAGQYRLIEVNARPWDQHRLGGATGVDLIHLAYCDLAGAPIPELKIRAAAGQKWIAEDAFIMALVRSLRGRERKLSWLLAEARGQRLYGLWSSDDPFPFIICMGQLGGQLLKSAIQQIKPPIGRRPAAKSSSRRMPHDYTLEKLNGKS